MFVYVAFDSAASTNLKPQQLFTRRHTRNGECKGGVQERERERECVCVCVCVCVCACVQCSIHSPEAAALQARKCAHW